MTRAARCAGENRSDMNRTPPTAGVVVGVHFLHTQKTSARGVDRSRRPAHVTEVWGVSQDATPVTANDGASSPEWTSACASTGLQIETHWAPIHRREVRTDTRRQSCSPTPNGDPGDGEHCNQCSTTDPRARIGIPPSRRISRMGMTNRRSTCVYREEGAGLPRKRRTPDVRNRPPTRSPDPATEFPPLITAMAALGMPVQRFPTTSTRGTSSDTGSTASARDILEWNDIAVRSVGGSGRARHPPRWHPIHRSALRPTDRCGASVSG
ncbi:hypothetical protein B0I31_1026 [Saccharothrix carnea]|uniref:Uncharacterized protein n=1 Tax=Saccharothrix carnea TaxID=1280637 RepID=A0A2P8IEX5_SACCR|nr:hypothetical protein B0I31_1026 [Saccharothrix carnea]